MSKEQSCCACSSSPTLIFPCSGASDVGEIADRAARTLTREGVGRMYCLAGIGGKVSGIVESAKAADRMLLIDGCPLSCAKHTMKQAGFERFEYIQLSELGLAKGSSPCNEERISLVVQETRKKLATCSVNAGGVEVMMTPALVVDGETKAVGKAPSEEEIKKNYSGGK